MSFLFGSMQRSPDQEAREHARTISSTVRETEREHAKLGVTERTILRDMKLSAKKGEIGSVQAMANELVRTRAQMAKVSQMGAQMKAIGMRLKSGQSTQAMVRAMRNSSRAMKGINVSMDTGALSKILMEFEKESSVLTDKQEFVDDRMDDVLGNDENHDQDVHEVVAKVFAEVGVDIGGQMASVPIQQPMPPFGAGGSSTEREDAWESEMSARIRNLKTS